MINKQSYERHLPHEIPEGFPIFLTWNLKGAMPREIIEKLRQEKERLEKQAARKGESARDRKLREGKLIFAMGDRFLDQAKDGPLHLKDPRAAKIVEDSILFGVGERYDLYAWCVVANHAHVLLMPIWDLKEVTQGIKGYTAHEINGLQNVAGADPLAGRVVRSLGPRRRGSAADHRLHREQPGGRRTLPACGGLALVVGAISQGLAAGGTLA